MHGTRTATGRWASIVVNCDGLAAALDDLSTQQVPPTPLARDAKRPGNGGIGPIRIGLEPGGKAGGNHDQGLLPLAARESTDMLGPGTLSGKRLIVAVRE